MGCLYMELSIAKAVSCIFFLVSTGQWHWSLRHVTSQLPFSTASSPATYITLKQYEWTGVKRKRCTRHHDFPLFSLRKMSNYVLVWCPVAYFALLYKIYVGYPRGYSGRSQEMRGVGAHTYVSRIRR